MLLCCICVGSGTVSAESDIMLLDLPHAPVIPKPADASMMLDDVNAARSENGKNALVRDDKLDEVAYNHAHDMIARHYFGHETPDGETFDQRFRVAGIAYRYAGENLAQNGGEVSAERSLMSSPEHRQNILQTRYHKIGIAAISLGSYTTFFVQEFSD